MQPQTFVFFGIVGSGKGTQVKLLMDFLEKQDGRECVYIGTGEIFRKIMASSENDPATQIVKDIVNSGRLMPDEQTNKLVLEVTSREASPEKHLFYDGYPRTVAQSEAFEAMMQSLKRQPVNIVYIEVSKEEAMKRNLLRGRHDDTEEGLAKRFDEYVKNVVPSMNYFKNNENYKIYTINGEQTVEGVQKDIVEALKLI